MAAQIRIRLQPDQRRQEIIEAARILYREKPYESVTTQDLANAVGVTRGLVHHYFGKKRTLFLEVMRGELVMPEKPVPHVRDAPLEVAVRRIMEWILDGASTFGQAWVNASGAANLHGRSDLQALVDQADDRAARLVLDAIGLPEDAVIRAHLRPVAALIKGACREWLQHHTLSHIEVLDLISDTVLLVVSPFAVGSPRP